MKNITKAEARTVFKDFEIFKNLFVLQCQKSIPKSKKFVLVAVHVAATNALNTAFIVGKKFFDFQNFFFVHIIPHINHTILDYSFFFVKKARLICA